MTYTIETYKKENVHISYAWDKHNGYEMDVCEVLDNGLARTIYHNTYATENGAKRAFQRQIKKMKGTK